MYKISTPNKRYSGVTEGVAFADGIGQTGCKNTRNVLVNDYGYTDITEQAKDLGTTTKNSAKEIAQANETLKDAADLEKLTVDELKEIAKNKELTNYSRLKRDELIELIKNENDA